MLPATLLCLICLILSTEAQTRTPLLLNNVATFTTETSFLIPGLSELNITIALCSSASPRFFISNSTNSAIEDDPGPEGGPDIREIQLTYGLGFWNGIFPNGGVLAVEDLPPGTSFEIAVSNNGPIHEILPDLPRFADSTSNQAIVYSHKFEDPPNLPKPQYPNYTLPSAESIIPNSPSSSRNLSLILMRTIAAPQLRTACFLNSSAVNTVGVIVNSSFWMSGSQDGWRNEWLLSGLSPSTNYTAFAIQDGNKVSGPINFVTKSASFSCTLVHSLPYCPSTTYAIPLAAPSGSDFPLYDSQNLPTEISSQVINVMRNFTVSLSTFACGRDWYSPLVGCDDCQREYRKWLCAVVFPRCSEPSPSNPRFVSPDPSTTGIINAGPTASADQPQAAFSALAHVPTSSTSSESLPFTSLSYTRLLPCIEVCTAVDRACPPFLGFKCPLAHFNGASSYGFGYIDGADGGERQGVTGTSQDRWGNVWCNAG